MVARRSAAVVAACLSGLLRHIGRDGRCAQPVHAAFCTINLCIRLETFEPRLQSYFGGHLMAAQCTSCLWHRSHCLIILSSRPTSTKNGCL